MKTPHCFTILLLAIIAIFSLTSCKTTDGTTFAVTPAQANVLATYGTVKVLKEYDTSEKWTSAKEKLLVITAAVQDVNLNGVSVDTLKPLLITKLGDDEETVLLVDLVVSFFPSAQVVPALNNAWVTAVTSGITRGVSISKAPTPPVPAA